MLFCFAANSAEYYSFPLYTQYSLRTYIGHVLVPVVEPRGLLAGQPVPFRPAGQVVQTLARCCRAYAADEHGDIDRGKSSNRPKTCALHFIQIEHFVYFIIDKIDDCTGFTIIIHFLRLTFLT